MAKISMDNGWSIKHVCDLSRHEIKKLLKAHKLFNPDISSILAKQFFTSDKKWLEKYCDLHQDMHGQPLIVDAYRTLGL